MTELSYDCLEKMDQLVHQSAKGIHILFDRADIVRAVQNEDAEVEPEDTLERLKHVQELLYTFIQLKTVDEKRSYIETLEADDYSTLIRAYFKIVDNSILNKTGDKH